MAVAVALCTTVATGTALAHHSFAAEFDANAPIELTGTVTKVDWANPLFAGSSQEAGDSK